MSDTETSPVSIRDVQRLMHATGRVLLFLGVTAAVVGTVVAPVESFLSGDGIQWVTWHGLAIGAGGHLVGWGGTLVAIARHEDVREAFRRSGIGRDVPLWQEEQDEDQGGESA